MGPRNMQGELAIMAGDCRQQDVKVARRRLHAGGLEGRNLQGGLGIMAALIAWLHEMRQSFSSRQAQASLQTCKAA